jgi:erythromycin esterase-like protein/predicted phosphoribosyltransferase
MPQRPFRDRREAGRKLAANLTAHGNKPDVLVLALPRGGVPVAYEVAHALNAPLDVFVVRKLGVPGHEEFAMGAVATGGIRVLNQQLVQRLGLPDYVIEDVTEREQEELTRRERAYRGGLPPPDVRDKTVILVDDGLATGATMQVAIEALRQQNPARIVVAVPVASREACEQMRKLANEVVCAVTPEPFHAVGLWYDDFSQTTDEEVRELLTRRRQPQEQKTTPAATDDEIIEAVRHGMHVLSGAQQDYDPLMQRIGDARIVLLGEASHGTHQFYHERALITRRLIEEKGFVAVAVEADWPDAWRVNRYVKDESQDLDAKEALADFRRFPTWMWRNTAVVTFIGWLRRHNDSLAPDAPRAGFYGLDLYSLHASMRAVLRYLEQMDPEAAKRARERYACFDHFGADARVYGFIAGTDRTKSCREAVVNQLVELRNHAMDHARRGGRLAEDELFGAEQNARVVKNAEAYYREMFVGNVSSWNLRDQHMFETLQALDQHIGRHGKQAKIVVWAHNSHLGDARATEMGWRGELNVGQLVREKYAVEAVLVGFTTHHGTVTAASDWGAAAERKRVRRALLDSHEAMFHRAHASRFLLTWNSGDDLARHLRNARLERAIGVIYRPETERMSHYFQARLADQFDAVIHFDETRALKPLEYTAEWEAGEVPETFPFAV